MIRIQLARWMSVQKTNYELLNVSVKASQDEIKKAYLGLAKKYHPDSPEGNEEMFKIITEAYTILKNEEKRAEYDNSFKKSSKGAKSKVKEENQDTHSSEKQHKRYTETFKSSSWSGGSFNNKDVEKERGGYKNVTPADVFIKMGTYAIGSSAVFMFVYILYLVMSPVPEKQKIVRPEGIVTKMPERSPAKS
ncbi:hypothetical protein SteCoe_11998 [Stentor coeruleus]|uniref:J domain-containing protein n=1 Tax=Stentor coeruleus TaxID=5963 RepID=A0A1R2CBW0_9CILI|nr:hypothetical protein SteCoe_11998 [Stentor coeruleus]